VVAVETLFRDLRLDRHGDRGVLVRARAEFLGCSASNPERRKRCRAASPILPLSVRIDAVGPGIDDAHRAGFRKSSSKPSAVGSRSFARRGRGLDRGKRSGIAGIDDRRDVAAQHRFVRQGLARDLDQSDLSAHIGRSSEFDFLSGFIGKVNIEAPSTRPQNFSGAVKPFGPVRADQRQMEANLDAFARGRFDAPSHRFQSTRELCGTCSTVSPALARRPSKKAMNF